MRRESNLSPLYNHSIIYLTLLVRLDICSNAGPAFVSAAAVVASGDLLVEWWEGERLIFRSGDLPLDVAS